MQNNKFRMRCSQVQVLLQRIKVVEVVLYSELLEGFSIWQIIDESDRDVKMIFNAEENSALIVENDKDDNEVVVRSFDYYH